MTEYKHGEHPLHEEILSRIHVCTIRNAFDAHDGVTVLYGTRPPLRSIHLLENLSKTEHFGNPFMTDKIAENVNKKSQWKTYKGYGNVEEVSKLFVEWIRGNVHQDIEPIRRKWLFDNIQVCKYQTTFFTYYRNCDKETSHIYEMIKYIITIERQMEDLIDDLFEDKN